MTTPAINRNESRYRVYNRKFWVNNILTQNQDENVVIWNVIENRPASVTSSFDGDGFRPPTNWNHSYRFEHAYLPIDFRSISWLHLREYGENGYSTYQFDGYTGYTPPWSNLEGRAINGALTKLKAQKVNLGVMFGERKQTARMFSDTIGSIARSIKNFKRRNPLDFLKARHNEGVPGKSIPANWLALQYGWKPALADLYASVNALSEKEQLQPPLITVTKLVGQKVIRSWAHTVDTQGYRLNWKESIQSGVSVSLTYKMDNSFVRTLTQLGVTNPLEIIWELVPYSFVLDWALPIGEWLGLLDATTGLVYKGGSVSRLEKRFAVPATFEKYRLSTNFPEEALLQVGGLDRLRRTDFAFSRTVLSSSPYPRIYFKNPLSLGHVANATALLATALSRTSR